MKVCLFLGPTLPAAEVHARLDDVTILPPAEHGDVHAAVRRLEPRLVGLVDGVFLDRPSVRHKEILWALERGVHVLGAASMGALRAAELESCGMEGVGAVFVRIRDAALPPFDGHGDDDEVAVVHGPPESGYLAVTEAMVNIRATLEAARAAGVLDANAAERLAGLAKSLHFTERGYPRLLERAARDRLSPTALARLRAWLPGGRVDRKREDALALLERIGAIRASGRVPRVAGPRFEPTEIWLQSVERRHDGPSVAAPAATQPATQPATASRAAGTTPDATTRAVLDELRLDPALYAATVERALVRALCAGRPLAELLRERADGARIERARLRLVGDRLRRENALWERDDIDAWLGANALDTAGCDALLQREADHRRLLARVDADALADLVVDVLRLAGRYHRLRVRAEDKTRVLERPSEGSPRRPPDPGTLLRWYFETVRGEPIPNPDALLVHCRALGLEDERAFLTLLEREYRYRRAAGVDSARRVGEGEPEPPDGPVPRASETPPWPSI